jgi:hypothetical protein
MLCEGSDEPIVVMMFLETGMEVRICIRSFKASCCGHTDTEMSVPGCEPKADNLRRGSGLERMKVDGTG